MGLVLSAWVQDLLASPPPGVTLDSVAKIPDLIRELKAAGKTNEEIDQAVAGELRFTEADRAETFGVDELTAPSPLLLGGTIPLWEWVGAYIDLNDIA